ncbi:MAG: hypothetical protein M1812_001371 [Candelaria pacifica]|nr:MAG: hypothetical protein M1812_001371 [Candelaria pacifica]
MSSPPNLKLSTSPPYPPPQILPSKKRSSSSLSSPSNPSKRRKPSNAPSGLRQASFPPEEPFNSNFTRSPSVESSIAGSSVARGVGGKKRKGGGKSKPGSVKNGSVLNGKAATTTGSVAGGKAGTAGAEDEGEDDLGEENAVMVNEAGQLDENAEKDKLQVLVDALNPDQTDRYETSRRVKLRKEVVRKITNQTLSQSVPVSVITTINGYTKIFIGEIIEKAREVQTQQLAASSTDGTVNERDRGPLLPDHLREALRRYKRDGEATAGFQGISLGGIIETAVKAKGRRLFR